MSRAVIVFLLTLCLASAFGQDCPAQERGGSPATNENDTPVEAMRRLEGRLKTVGSVTLPRYNSTVRLNSVHAEGCVLRYKLTTERESHSLNYSNLPQVSDDRFHVTDDEWTVRIADLDPARLMVENALGMKDGVEVAFYAERGKAAITRARLVNYGLGLKMHMDRMRRGYLLADDASSLEGVIKSIRHAINVCRAAAP